MRLPQGKIVFAGEKYSPQLLNSLIGRMREEGHSFIGTLMAEDPLKHLFLFIFQDQPYAAGQMLGDIIQPFTLRDFFRNLSASRDPLLTLYQCDPIFFKCLLVLAQKTPSTRALVAFLNLEDILTQISAGGENAVVILRKGLDFNFFYFLRGRMVGSYFSDTAAFHTETSRTDSLLLYAYAASGEEQVEAMVYHDLAVDPSSDANVCWEELAEDAVGYFLKPRPELVVTFWGKSYGRYPLLKKKTLVGRAEFSDVLLEEKKVSREHAVILEVGEHYLLEDKGSLNGTLVNGRRIAKAQLANGDEIRMGDFRLLFLESAEAKMKEDLTLAEEETIVRREEPLSPEKAVISPGTLVLEVIQGEHQGKVFRMTKEKTLIGKMNTEILLRDPTVSRQHAGIERTDNCYVFVDLQSKNGSYINGERTSRKILAPHDIIKIGKTFFRVVIE